MVYRFQGFACVALVALLGLSGCATVPGTPNPKDPYQSFNRAMYQFNDTVDRAVLKPVAQGYDAVTPDFLQQGVRNFFSNLKEILVVFNDLLQGKVSQGGRDTVRFAINSTVGLVGLIDVASPMGLERHEQDFGLTLGRWGVDSGPYLVLPFLGPSTVRDTVARVGDLGLTPYLYATHISTTHRDEIFVLETVSGRAGLLKSEGLVNEAALSNDHYNFIRDAWLQRRQNKVYEGHPPLDPEDSLDDDPGPTAK